MARKKSDIIKEIRAIRKLLGPVDVIVRANSKGLKIISANTQLKNYSDEEDEYSININELMKSRSPKLKGIKWRADYFG